VSPDAEEVEAILHHAFPRLDVGKLTYRKVIKMHRRACRLVRLLRGDEIDPREAIEEAAGFTPAQFP